jgi:hypothetical protein
MQNNTQALLNDIFDYIMENEYDIGTNFRVEFPNTYFDEKNEQIIILDKNNEFMGAITLKLNPKYR